MQALEKMVKAAENAKIAAEKALNEVNLHRLSPIHLRIRGLFCFLLFTPA